MEVKAIDSLSLQQFEGVKKSKRVDHKQSYPQMHAPASKKAAKAMRDMMMGLMLLGATAGTMTSCDDMFEAHADASAWAKAWACGGQAKSDTTVVHDTINHVDTVFVTDVEPVNFKEYPFHIADSLINQGLNIGVELDGPVPSAENNNVVFLASKAHNRYDNKFYETHAQYHGTTGEVLTTITKCVDMYDAKHPKTQWIKSMITDLPGEGIQIDRFVSGSEAEPTTSTRWNYAGYEIRTNNRNGKTNTVRVYDKNDQLIGERKGEYLRGQEAGTFMYGTVVYDDDGTPFIDPDDGQVVWTYYDFDQAKMWSDRVDRKDVPETTTTYYYGTK